MLAERISNETLCRCHMYTNLGTTSKEPNIFCASNCTSKSRAAGAFAKRGDLSPKTNGFKASLAKAKPRLNILWQVFCHLREFGYSSSSFSHWISPFPAFPAACAGCQVSLNSQGVRSVARGKEPEGWNLVKGTQLKTGPLGPWRASERPSSSPPPSEDEEVAQPWAGFRPFRFVTQASIEKGLDLSLPWHRDSDR